MWSLYNQLYLLIILINNELKLFNIIQSLTTYIKVKVIGVGYLKQKFKRSYFSIKSKITRIKKSVSYRLLYLI